MPTKAGTTNRATTKKGPRPAANAENISAYFRAIFRENRQLLKTRSNDALLQRWLDDHPSETEVPHRVKESLSNVKSVLRKKLKKRGRKKAEAQPTGPGAAQKNAAPVPAASSDLEQLEEQIDECMALAKKLDREGLEDVIAVLRRARNAVVWKLGE